MEGIILSTNSQEDIKLILLLAKKMGIISHRLTPTEVEDYALSNAINEGNTGEYIDTDSFLNELHDGSKDWQDFQKDAAKIDQKALFNLIADSIINVRDASRINEIKNLKKLKGTANHYRIKIGDYRLGIIISKGSVKFIRCFHRKDIYKYFPG